MGGAASKNEQLPHLETFSVAAELCNFTKTARALGLTQAAVSLRIQTLESALGKNLFQRQSGQVILTEAGHTLYAYAQRILQLNREATAAVTAVHLPPAGQLFIAGSSIPGEHVLPSLLAAFNRKYPHIRVHATVTDSLAAIEQVEHGEASLGLVGRKAESPNLEFTYLASDRVVLVVPAGHALAKKSVTVRQLAEQPLILREAGSGLRHWFEKALDRAGQSPAGLHVVLELGSNEAIKEAVIRGLGLAVMSRLAVVREIEAGKLRALDIKGIDCDRDMFVVRDRRRVLPLPARLLLSFLEANPVADLGT